MNSKKMIVLAAFALLFTASAAHAQLGTTAPTATITANVNPEMALTLQTPALVLTQTGNNFSPYTGTANYTYFIRTTTVGGSGAVTVEVTTDFSNGAANKPSVATPPTAGDVLSYVGAVSAPGTAASANASTTAQTNIATFGAAAHSTFAGNTGSVAWTLTNDPLYPTGSYTSTITYTISAA